MWAWAFVAALVCHSVAATEDWFQHDRFSVHISTDRQVYRHGDVVRARAMLLEAFTRRPAPDGAGERGVPVASIVSPQGSTVWERVLTTARDGFLGVDWTVPRDLPGGDYKLRIVHRFGSGVPPAERKFNVRVFRPPRLSSVLEFARKGYSATDWVEASLDVRRAEGGHAANATVHAAARVDGTYIDAGTHTLDADGHATIRFQLPHYIYEGVGSLTCAISDGGVQESVSKTLPLLLRRLRVDVYPEGGNLVFGVPNRVYVEAATPTGDPADFEAQLYEGETPLDVFVKTVHEGRGRLTFVPMPNRGHYTLRVTRPAGITEPVRVPMPVHYRRDVALTALRDVYETDQPVTIQLATTQPGDYQVSLYHREVELASQVVTFDPVPAPPGSKGPAPALIQNVSLVPPQRRDGRGRGVLRVTVYTPHGHPAAERLVFVRPLHAVQVNVTSAAKSYRPGDKVELTVRTTDARGRPVAAAVAVTVADDAVVQLVEKREQAPRLPAMALLENEVKHLEDAHVYFDPPDPLSPRSAAANVSADEALDLLLGTQGWRRWRVSVDQATQWAPEDLQRAMVVHREPEAATGPATRQVCHDEPYFPHTPWWNRAGAPLIPMFNPRLNITSFLFRGDGVRLTCADADARWAAAVPDPDHGYWNYVIHAKSDMATVYHHARQCMQGYFVTQDGTLYHFSTCGHEHCPGRVSLISAPGQTFAPHPVVAVWDNETQSTAVLVVPNASDTITAFVLGKDGAHSEIPPSTPDGTNRMWSLLRLAALQLGRTDRRVTRPSEPAKVRVSGLGPRSYSGTTSTGTTSTGTTSTGTTSAGTTGTIHPVGWSSGSAGTSGTVGSSGSTGTMGSSGSTGTSGTIGSTGTVSSGSTGATSSGSAGSTTAGTSGTTGSAAYAVGERRMVKEAEAVRPLRAKRAAPAASHGDRAEVLGDEIIDDDEMMDNDGMIDDDEGAAGIDAEAAVARAAALPDVAGSPGFGKIDVIRGSPPSDSLLDPTTPDFGLFGDMLAYSTINGSEAAARRPRSRGTSKSGGEWCCAVQLSHARRHPDTLEHCFSARSAAAPLNSVKRVCFSRVYAHRTCPNRSPGDRVDFTQTVFFAPYIKTNAKGMAVVTFELPDSVTSFRVFADAVAPNGGLGTNANLLVESKQGFYVEPKVPLEVSVGDRIVLPVAVVNALDQPIGVTGSVEVIGRGLALEQGSDAFNTSLDAGQRGRVLLHLHTTGANDTDALIRVNASSTAEAASTDSVTRAVRVKPTGFPDTESYSGVLLADTPKTIMVNIQDDVIPLTTNVDGSLHLTPYSNLATALAGLLREPTGCFEQTSSVNYPMVMAQTYFKSQHAVDPALVERTSQLLANGYKRLVGYECQGGGFDWFGHPPGNEALTAYGVLQFTDMKKVHPVEDAMLTRTVNWLMSRRDGKGGFLRHSSAIDTFGRASKEVTDAYITWALFEAGMGDRLSAERDNVFNLVKDTKDMYLTALAAGTALSTDRPEIEQLCNRLVEGQDSSGAVKIADHSITRSGGRSLEIETTSLAVLAWLNRGGDKYRQPVELAMHWLMSVRQNGMFGATQSTVLALKAIVAYEASRRNAPTPGSVFVHFDGHLVAVSHWNASRLDAVKLPNFGDRLTRGEHNLTMTLSGPASVSYSVDVSSHVATPPNRGGCDVLLHTALRSARVHVGDSAELVVTLTKNTTKSLPMLVAIVGLPGGLEVRHKRLSELVKSEQVAFYETFGAREVVLYWRQFAPDQHNVTVVFDLMAAVPGNYTAPASRAYLYYTPERKHWNAGTTIEISA